MKFIPRTKTEAAPQRFENIKTPESIIDDYNLNDSKEDLPAEPIVRFSLETFFKQYIAIEKKYNKS